MPVAPAAGARGDVLTHGDTEMAGQLKTEAVVLRWIRYGEADRVLHLSHAARGRIGGDREGIAQPRSRFGGRLEPFFRLDLVLHEGRGT